MSAPTCLPAVEVAERLERLVRESPADETEAVWIEARRGVADRRAGRPEAAVRGERTILVRVIDHGRMGAHRSGAAAPGELANAVRQAIAQSRANQPLPGLLHFAVDDGLLGAPPELVCPEVAALDRRGAQEWLQTVHRGREAVAFSWAVGHVTVFNSRGMRRQAEATAVAFEARLGRRPGAGRASDAARRLPDLAAAAVVECAAGRHAQGDAGDLPPHPLPALLGPEAIVQLVKLLNRVAFTASAYADGSSLLREHLGVQVFDRAIHLRDDGTDPAGLPFPFDLEGTAKRPVDLILQGSPRTPALDQRQAAQLGLPPTGHAVSGNDARAEHLFLVPGEATTDDLLHAADGGLWVGWLEAVECLDPRRLQFRARACGVRRIRDGRLAEGLPDALWEDSLLRALAERPVLGGERARQLSRDGLLGGVTAPAAALPMVGPLKPAP